MKFNTFQNREPLKTAKQLGWNLLTLTDLLKDDSRNVRKIKKSDYLGEGLKPIIDQGKQLIGGYSNLNEGFYNEESYIIFGDHTRIIKYIDFPSFVGADGVKVLKNRKRNIVDTKYLYYFLQSINIPDAGYSRHFKFLKEVIVPVPPLNVQSQIVDIISKVHSVSKKRKKQIEALSALKQSVFFDMFDTVSTNKYNFKIDILGNYTTLVTSGSTPRGGAKSYLDEGIPLIRSQNVLWNEFDISDVAYIAEETHESMRRSQLNNKDVLFNITGASIGRCSVYEGDNNSANVNQHVCIIRLNDKINPYYLSYFLTGIEFQKNVVSKNIGATRQAFNYTQIKNFNLLIPDISLQNEFEAKVKQIDASISSAKESLMQLNSLSDALLHKAFNGELFKEEIEA